MQRAGLGRVTLSLGRVTLSLSKGDNAAARYFVLRLRAFGARSG
jgi:hypothetical protein